MAAKPRRSIFENSDLDVTGFAPKPVYREAPPPAEEVRAVAEAANFNSRENPKRAPRRYRTGRNVQLNLKVNQATADELYRICDAQSWVLGEGVARALAALKRELENKTPAG